MQHKFPFVSLRMEMEGNDLDVNVHPAKREVRFAREQEVYDAVYDMVRSALTRREMIPKVSVDSTPAKTETKEEKITRAAVPEPFETKRREEMYPNTVRKPEVQASLNPKPKVQANLNPKPEARDGLNERTEIRKPLSQSTPSKTLVSEPAAEYRPAFSKAEEEMFSGTLRENQKLDEEKKQAELKLTEEPEKKQAPPQQLELFEEKLLAPESRSRIRVVGQIFDTYWLVQFEDNFYIIDQHAAHEKVYYERMVKQFREHSIDSQYLSPPMIVTLSMQEEEVLNSNKDYFEQFGFEIENFGGREYRISAVPSNLYGLTEEDLFLEMLDNLSGNNSRDALDIFASKLATMACKAAVKGNHAMSFEEAEKLIDELLTLDNPYHCPHGRPTIIAMTRTELEKKFKRIV